MRFSNQQLTSTLQKYIEKAEVMIKSNQAQSKVNKMIASIRQDKRIDKAFAGVFGQFNLAVNLVKDYYKGVYRNVSSGSVLKIVAALIYVVNPFDIVPDFLLGIGFLDDVAVFKFMLDQIGLEIEKYREFRESEGDVDILDE